MEMEMQKELHYVALVIVKYVHIQVKVSHGR